MPLVFEAAMNSVLGDGEQHRAIAQAPFATSLKQAVPALEPRTADCSLQGCGASGELLVNAPGGRARSMPGVPGALQR